MCEALFDIHHLVKRFTNMSIYKGAHKWTLPLLMSPIFMKTDFQIELHLKPFLSHAGVRWWTLCMQCCQVHVTGQKRITLILVPGFCKVEKNGVSVKQKTQSGHGMEMINRELHYWKASLIRCSHLPGEPAQHWRPGSHCCFFINTNFLIMPVQRKQHPWGLQGRRTDALKHLWGLQLILLVRFLVFQ